jgi:hypothetical protein
MVSMIMRVLLFLVFLSMCSTVAQCAFNATTQWDVRTTGSDSNGGAFDPGVVSPGTDESQSNSGTSITITVGGTNTQGTGSPAFTSTTHGPGNFINITGGAGCTVQTVEVLSQSAGTATFDKSMGGTTLTCTGTIGGSLLTNAAALSLAVTSNTINVKSGTYTITTVLSVTQPIITWLGYNSTHGDGGTKPLITTSTNSTDLVTLTGTATGGEILIQNISFSNTASTRGNGIQASGPIATGALVIINCVFDGFSAGFQAAINGDNVGSHFRINNIGIRGTEIKNSYYGLSLSNTALTMLGSYVHNNTSDGVLDGGAGVGASFVRSTFASNGGEGINYNTSTPLSVDSCVFYSNVDGIKISAGGFLVWNSNNIFYGQSGYGVNAVGSNVNDNRNAASYANAFGSNTTGNQNNYPSFPSVITLTANPFTNAGTGNFSLNSTAGGGAALKAAGYPGVSPAGTGHVDVGAIQSNAATIPNPITYIF